MNSVWKLSVNIAEIIIVYDFLIRYFNYRRKSAAGYLITVLSEVVSVAILTFTSDIIFFKMSVVLSVSIVNFLFCILLLKGSLSEKIFFSMFIMAYANLISSLTALFFSDIFGRNISQTLAAFDFVQVAAAVAGELLFFCAARALLFLKEKPDLMFHEFPMLLIMPLCSLVAAETLVPAAFGNAGIQRRAFVFLLIIAVLDLLPYSFFFYIGQMTKLKDEYLLLELQYRNEQKNNRETRKLYEEVRSIRHDMRNHLLCISILAQRNKCDRILDYIQELSKKEENNCRMDLYTGNDALDAILNTKIAVAEQDGIQCSASVSSVELPLSQSDISVLIGNLMDNAYEAASKAPEKWIGVKICGLDNAVSIRVHNTTAHPVLAENPFLLTSKEDRKLHGLGTRNIRRIVNRYNGTLEYCEQKNVFMCNITIPLEKSSGSSETDSADRPS